MFRLRRNSVFGFTLVELLVVISVIALLIAILMPALVRARDQANAAVCLSNIRQLSFAFVLYSEDYNGYAMPTYDPQANVYWWGQKLFDGIDRKKGFVWPYLRSELKKNSVYECPAQKYGSYRLQGKPSSEPDDPKWITSTYGYNGYYLSPPGSAWIEIQHRPWQKITTVEQPALVLTFADAMLDWDITEEDLLSNTALLDPPYLLSNDGSCWEKNLCPTTCFRHNDKVNAAFVDGHCSPMRLEGGEYTSPKSKIGSISEHNAPYYVPDYKQWPVGRRRRR